MSDHQYIRHGGDAIWRAEGDTSSSSRHRMSSARPHSHSAASRIRPRAMNAISDMALLMRGVYPTFHTLATADND